MPEIEVGKVIHFFGKVSVAAVKLSGELAVGDSIKVKTRSGEFVQKVESMQVDKTAVPKAAAGADIGIKVAGHVKEGDTVYKVI